LIRHRWQVGKHYPEQFVLKCFLAVMVKIHFDDECLVVYTVFLLNFAPNFWRGYCASAMSSAALIEGFRNNAPRRGATPYKICPLASVSANNP